MHLFLFVCVVKIYFQHRKMCSKETCVVGIHVWLGYSRFGLLFLDCFHTAIPLSFQVWASSYLPCELRIKDRTQREYLRRHSKPMLVDYLEKELTRPMERVVMETEHWVWLVPYWACWPFETMLLPRRHVLRLELLTQDEKKGLRSAWLFSFHFCR